MKPLLLFFILTLIPLGCTQKKTLTPEERSQIYLKQIQGGAECGLECQTKAAEGIWKDFLSDPDSGQHEKCLKMLEASRKLAKEEMIPLNQTPMALGINHEDSFVKFLEVIKDGGSPYAILLGFDFVEFTEGSHRTALLQSLNTVRERNSDIFQQGLKQHPELSELR